MAVATINYSSNTTITMNLSGLASSSNFISGRESTQIDNTTNKYIDAIVEGSVSVGTNPTVNSSIGVWVWGSDTSLATSPIDVLDGADSTVTFSQLAILYSALKIAGTTGILAATSDVAYPFAPFSVAALFGGVMPKYWGLYVAHNTGQNLRATGTPNPNTNSFSFVGIKYDIV